MNTTETARKALKEVRKKMLALAVDIVDGEMCEEFIERETRALNNELKFWESVLSNSKDDMNTITADESSVRLYVNARMAPLGVARKALTNEQKKTVWLAADGFGPHCSASHGESQCWDYSHVRDSSAQGYFRMYRLVRRFEEINQQNGGPLSDGSYRLNA